MSLENTWLGDGKKRALELVTSTELEHGIRCKVKQRAVVRWSKQDSFTRQVLWTLLRDVKFGEAVSYKQLADLAGNSKAARAVGGAMRSNPIPIIIPCHRVIRSGGQSGNYGGGHVLKEWLLSHEKLQKEKLAP
ncbi:Mgmt [Columba guinea]|nr:Mgmt [Columba guinea]